jgi:hypothetical protein
MELKAQIATMIDKTKEIIKAQSASAYLVEEI